MEAIQSNMDWNLSRSLYTMIKFPNPWAKFPWGGLVLHFPSWVFHSSTLTHSLLFSLPSSLSFPPTLQPWYLICCWDSSYSFYSLGCLLLYTFLSFCSVVITYQSLFYTGPDESSSDEGKQSSCLKSIDMVPTQGHIVFTMTFLLHTFCTMWLIC